MPDRQGLRLLAAVTTAFAVLDEYGFQVRDTDLDHGRGATVVVASKTVSIDVTADWYERELSVSVRVEGSAWTPVERLVPALRGVTRLPRDATRGVLEERLTKIVKGLREHTPEILSGGTSPLT